MIGSIGLAYVIGAPAASRNHVDAGFHGRAVLFSAYRKSPFTRRHPNGRNRAQIRCQGQPVRTAGSGGEPTFAEPPVNGEVAP
jgi:hypothetical protein